MNLKNTLWVVAASLLGATSPALAQDMKPVSVDAEADFSGDLSATEKELKRQARRKAVEQGVGVSVSSNSIVRNFELVADEIVSEAKGIITDEKWGPITDGPTGSTKKITLSAKVSKNVQDLEKAACTVIKANHDPKIALVMVEKIGDSEKWTTERGLIEAMFAESFMNSCFTLVEPGVRVTEVSASGDLPQSVIAEIVKNADAQYVVLGQGKVVESKSDMLGNNMKSYNVSASLKLLNTSNNVIEAVVAKQVQVLAISHQIALDMKRTAKTRDGFVNTAMNELVEKIAVRWQGETMNAGLVQVQVTNVANYAAAKVFKETAEKTLKTRVEQRTVTGGKATYDISVDGGADALASSLEGKKAGKYTIEVIEVSKGKVVLKLN